VKQAVRTCQLHVILLLWLLLLLLLLLLPHPTFLCTARCLSVSCLPLQYQPTMSCLGNTVLSAASSISNSSN
jgi:hypothetical protein